MILRQDEVQPVDPVQGLALIYRFISEEETIRDDELRNLQKDSKISFQL